MTRRPPAADEPARPAVFVGPAADDAVVAFDEPAGRARTILLAEDDGTVRALIRQVLRREGYAVLDAGHGPQALRLAAAHPGPIDLLVTDVVMPEMTGRQLADLLADARPGLKVLYVSGYGDDEVARHGVDAAARSFLPKPFGPAALTRRIAELLEV
jgi:two-component system cell cycle sensor histidine kinase/response regulator CckA